jgi:hypothetical protein
MPFGNKTDPRSGIEIDFDRVYEQGIRPAVEGAGLQCVRGDRERTGGIIHTAMFARLLLSEFVIADLTSANPNVFYELGVRHAAKPRTTIPIFATIGDLPFDVNLVRAIPYDLDKGHLTEKMAEALREALRSRIRDALQGPVAQDSPLFQLFDSFPGIEMSHETTDVLRERVRYSQDLKDRLEDARSTGSRDLALAQIKAIQKELGDLKTVERGVLVDLFLSYRDVEGWDEMISLYRRLPADLHEAVVVRQQYAMAANRRGGPGDRRRATRELERILKDFGESAETYGLLGRIYKDLYRSTPEGDEVTRTGYLDRAIEAYTKGFECEPIDYYPGVNAITLLMKKGTSEAAKEAARLVPLVTFAAVRQGGAESDDYWTVATVLELAFNGRDYELAERVVPRLLTLEAKPWMLRTTADNLQLLMDLRKTEENIGALVEAVSSLRDQADRREKQTL